MDPLSLNLSKNDTICGCDGNIIIKGYGGTPPYTYSINNGLTYNSSPIFTNLCMGNYSVYIMDNTGGTSSNMIILNPPINPVTYSVRLSTSNTITTNTSTQITKIYTTDVLISPELPQGSMVTMDLNHLNVFKTSPNSGSSSNITSSILYKNLSPINNDYSSTTTSTTFNTIAGCQLNTVYITSYLESWKNLSFIYGDNIKLQTTTTVNKNENINCYIGESNEDYNITNLRLTGCSCCSIIKL